MGSYKNQMKFTYAALAAVATAEQMYGFVGESNSDFPSVTTPLTFVQSAGQENFQILMDQTSETQIPPHSTPTASLISPELQPTQLKSFNLSSSASFSELRSTMRSSIRPPQLPTQVPFGPHLLPSQSHLLLQAPSTISRLTVLMLTVTLSSPCLLPSTSLD